MKNPEMMLTELNNALRRLRGACGDLHDEDIDFKLLEVMRRLLLAEVLANNWIVAIGGSQGAGKTTLMASLYGCQEWLQSNEGRGEKMPVLILEQTDLDKPQGYVRRLISDEATSGFCLSDVEVEISEFQCAMYDPSAEDILPVLRVPHRYFKRDNQAWLLLPGYEKQQRSNQAWQALMRQAMIAAGGCIVVTDETRMANQQQLEIVMDMLEGELKHCEPCIVISKTEPHRHNIERQSSLRSSAQAIFQVRPELVEKNIILTGTDDADYIEEWMPTLRSAIEELNFNGQSDRNFQMSHLAEILRKDLALVLNAIRSKALLHFDSHKDGSIDGVQVLNEILEQFDTAAEGLRSQHNERVMELAGNALIEAGKVLDNKLIENVEGFKNWLSNAFDTDTTTKRKMQDVVRAAWSSAVPNFFKEYAKALSDLTVGSMDPSDDEVVSSSVDDEKIKQVNNKKIEMGYYHKSGYPVRFRKINNDMIGDIKILLGNGGGQFEASKSLSKSVKLIPHISLEYARFFYAMPELVVPKLDAGSLNDEVDGNIVENGVENLNRGVELGKTAVKSVAAVLAVDVLSDGDSDILDAIFGNKGPINGEHIPPVPVPATIPPAAVAAVAVVASAYITTKAIKNLRAIERKASAQAHNMLSNIYDYHVDHLRKQFDKTMNVVREHIKEKIRERYRMDEMLMRKDRLARSIADVKSLSSDLQSELDSSQHGLQLFLPDREA